MQALFSTYLSINHSQTYNVNYVLQW